MAWLKTEYKLIPPPLLVYTFSRTHWGILCMSNLIYNLFHHPLSCTPSRVHAGESYVWQAWYEIYSTTPYRVHLLGYRLGNPMYDKPDLSLFHYPLSCTPSRVHAGESSVSQALYVQGSSVIIYNRIRLFNWFQYPFSCTPSDVPIWHVFPFNPTFSHFCF